MFMYETFSHSEQHEINIDNIDNEDSYLHQLHHTTTTETEIQGYRSLFILSPSPSSV